MSEFEIFMELLDEKMLDYILAKFFSYNNPKQHINIKKMKLQKLLREPLSKSMNKLYRSNGNSCMQVLKMELVDKDLLDCDMDNFITAILSGKKNTLSDLELFLTSYVKFPNIIKEHFNTIVKNHKENIFLFKGIEEFNVSEEYLYSIELSKLQQDINILREEMEKLRFDLYSSKDENNKLNIHINEIDNENKKLKKDIKKLDKKFIEINNENKELKNTIENKEELLSNKNKEIEELKNISKKLEKDNRIFNNKYTEINKKYEEIRNKEYIDIINNSNITEYEACLIFTSKISAIRSLFRDILFISYEEYSNDSESVINRLNKFKINNVYIMSNNLSMRELGTLKRRIRKEGINYKTLLLSSELNMVKDLIKNINNDRIY